LKAKIKNLKLVPPCQAVLWQYMFRC